MQTAVNLTKQQPPIRVNKHLVTFCTAAIFLYAISRLWVGSQISGYLEAAFLVPFYYTVCKNWWYFKKQYLTWLVIATLGVPIVQFLFQYYQDPVLAIKSQGVEKLFKQTFFLATAFWLAHNIKLVTWFIIANLLGLFILIIIQPDLSPYIQNAFNGLRTSFKAINEQFMALYTGVGLTSLICLSLEIKHIRNTRIRLSTYFLSILLIIALIIPFIASQTRAAFLGAILIFFTAIWLLAKHEQWHLKKILAHPYILLFTTSILITSIIATTHSNFPERITSEINNLEQSYIKTGSVMPDSLGGGRGELWKFAINKALEKPIIGWGGNAGVELFKHSDNKSNYWLHRAHNAWLDFSIAFGVAGIILLTCLIWAIFRISLKQWHLAGETNHIALLVILSMTLLITMNQFESYLFSWQGSYLLTWIAAPTLAYAIHFKATLKTTISIKKE